MRTGKVTSRFIITSSPIVLNSYPSSSAMDVYLASDGSLIRLEASLAEFDS